ncbi:glycoside hydrolase family 9 protein [Chryseosolibacter indicus]|uniref:Glycoside hydrolase family 9 protein n=1 Tax=Chryseosolibacter indicus TaxID=2782351 RepID=A0ABS5VW53_9BACT|nr:glycoside hydrolase family 9 protein [Chryseosolibacter indicus]MBT1705052.1 glycoside hydrolase family 9 protein [Chryseosolibacter indicus]
MKICLRMAILLQCISVIVVAQNKYIVIDQFGYLTNARKIAVIRDPQTGFDAADSFTPGTTYSVVSVSSGNSVFTGSPTAWNNGTTDVSSGDKAWWFDFSSVNAPGKYYILDVNKDVRSYEFNIGDDVYKNILKHAVRSFFYQRVGFEKATKYAGAEWADAASHIKNLQDKNARQYNRQNDASTERDVSGGWYDAGDYNKYTNWTANYVVDFMRAYLEAPGVWGDDYNIPESGNHVPDILDEARWGIDHLLRMQNENGSVLSIVGLSHASPPSSAAGPTLYGTPSTSATLNTAAAFAIASKVYGGRGMISYSNKLKDSAIKAWNWANANPNVIFKNNDNASGTAGLGAGQQETDDYGRLVAKLEAAVFLFEITNETKYRDFFDSNYSKVHLIEWNFAYPFETANQEILLYYTKLPKATPSVVNPIKAVYKDAMNGEENLAAYYNAKDPYRAHIKDYTWGSNSTKGSQGLMFMDLITYGIDDTKNEDAAVAAVGYINYLHGVNPLSLVYLSNMYAYGADNGVNEFYHSWFANGSSKWDRAGVSTYGPAPGYVTGGPNPGYDYDACCGTNTCGGNNNAICNSESLTPPRGQPAQKSYKDFNTSWPLNSWSVTENSNGYQLNYIRLLSKFVAANYDCSGTLNGTASYDACNQCTGGDTGIERNTDATNCSDITEPITSTGEEVGVEIQLAPNPTHGVVTIKTERRDAYIVSVMDSKGNRIVHERHHGSAHINLSENPSGMYLIVITSNYFKSVKKVIKL